MKFSNLTRLSSLFLIGALAACSDDRGGDAFDAPDLSAIVQAATPLELRTSSLVNSIAKYNPLKALGDIHLFGCSAAAGGNSSSCSTTADYISFIQSEVFQDIEGVAEPMFYQYWVNVVDEAMAETNERLGTVAPACLSEAAVAVDFSFNIAGYNVVVSPKLQCWEEQSAPGDTTQNFAFGKDDDNFYLVFRTNDNAETDGAGVRIIIAMASADGNLADIWFLGHSIQSSVDSVNAQRIIANKATGEFIFNSVEDRDSLGSLFSSFFGHTDGTHAYFEAAYGSGGYNNVTGMEPNNSGWCATIVDLATEAAGECTEIDADSLPASFSLTVPMSNTATTKWQDDATADTAFITAMDAIEAIDYTTAGVTEL